MMYSDIIVKELHVLMTIYVLSSDPSIIPHHLIPVFQAITKDWAMIGDPNVGSSIIGGYSIGGYYTTVPHARAELFRTKFSVSDQRTEAGKYYALYHMNPNWKKLSLFLYSEGETLALDIARPYIQTVTGINNVMFTCTTYT